MLPFGEAWPGSLIHRRSDTLAATPDVKLARNTASVKFGAIFLLSGTNTENGNIRMAARCAMATQTSCGWPSNQARNSSPFETVTRTPFRAHLTSALRSRNRKRRIPFPCPHPSAISPCNPYTCRPP
jgi:hypothetical protein